MEFYSSPYMLESIAEQKMELAAYAAECSDIPQLSAHQLSITVEPPLSGPRLSKRSIIRTRHNAVYTFK